MFLKTSKEDAEKNQHCSNVTEHDRKSRRRPQEQKENLPKLGWAQDEISVTKFSLPGPKPPKNVPLAQRTMQLSPFQDPQQTVRAQKPREESRPFKVQRWSFYLELEDAKTPAPAQKEKREDRQQKTN